MHRMSCKCLNHMKQKLHYKTLRKNCFARSFDGAEKNCSGGASSTICPSSIKMTRSATSRANSFHE